MSIGWDSLICINKSWNSVLVDSSKALFIGSVVPLTKTPEMSHWRGGGLWHLVRETAVVAATNGKFKTSSYSNLELCSIQRPGNVELRPNEPTWCQCIYVLRGVFLYASIAVQDSACQMVSKETLYKIVVYSKTTELHYKMSICLKVLAGRPR